MNKRANSVTAWWSALIAVVLLCLPLDAGAAAPNPSIIGPIPATVPLGDPSRDYPFFATDVNLAQYGYVEQEYFMQGTANQYTTRRVPLEQSLLQGIPTRLDCSSDGQFRPRRSMELSFSNGTTLPVGLMQNSTGSRRTTICSRMAMPGSA